MTQSTRNARPPAQVVPRLLVLLAAIPLCLLFPSPAEAGTQYYVRTDGRDDPALLECDGRTNAAWSLLVQPNCAFLTPQFAVDPIRIMPGDDVQIAAGTYDAFQLPRLFAQQGDDTIIAGDPTVARTEIVINANGFGGREAILSNRPAFNFKTRYLTIKHLSFKVGTHYGINLNGYHEDILLTDLETAPSLFGSQLCCADSATLGLDPNFPIQNDPNAPNFNPTDGTSRAAAIRAWGPGQRSKITVLYSRLIAPGSGPATFTSDDVSGVNANAIVVNADASRVKGVEAGHFMGSFVHEIAGNSYIENNVVTDTVCAGGEGCIYSYNDKNIVIRRNVLDRMRPGGLQTAIRIRRTNSSQPETSVFVYNNTLIGKPGQMAAPEIGMEWAKTDGAIPTHQSVFLNNIVMHLGKSGNVFGTPDSYAVELGHCPVVPGGQFQIGNNQYWANAVGFHTSGSLNFKSNSNCSTVTDTYSVEINPVLDSIYQPAANGYACTGGTTGFTAPDGDLSSPYIGAKPCATGGSGGDPGCSTRCDEEQ